MSPASIGFLKTLSIAIVSWPSKLPTAISRALQHQPCPAGLIFMPAGSKQPVVVHYIEHCPPDVGAAFIWLKNRDPDRWRDVQNVEHVLGKYIISDRPMTRESGLESVLTCLTPRLLPRFPNYLLVGRNIVSSIG
jgi:hypothetical protein